MARLFGLSNYGRSRASIASSIYGNSRTKSTRKFSNSYRSKNSAASRASSRYSGSDAWSEMSAKIRKILKSKQAASTQNQMTTKQTAATEKATTEKASKSLSDLKTYATQLADSAKKLNATGDNSLFSEKNVSDRDAIYKTAKNFTENYNSMIENLDVSSDKSISTTGDNIVRITSLMSRGLSKIGINVDKSGKLSLDEKTFKAASLENIKDVFQGSSSYASLIASSSARLASKAANQLGQTTGNLYSKTGNYNDYKGGSMFNSVS